MPIRNLSPSAKGVPGETRTGVNSSPESFVRSRTSGSSDGWLGRSRHSVMPTQASEPGVDVVVAGGRRLRQVSFQSCRVGWARAHVPNIEYAMEIRLRFMRA